MNTPKAQLVLKLKKIIHGKWFFYYLLSFWKTRQDGSMCVHGIAVFVVGSVSTLVRPAQSESPKIGGIIILNLASSELKLGRK